jgi:hypothetical protein
VEGLIKFLFADDFSIMVRTFLALLSLQPFFARFERVTGYGLNIPKCGVLCTIRHERTYRNMLNNLPLNNSWRGLQLLESTKHLGVLMGRNVSKLDIWEAALLKFEGRVRKCKLTCKMSVPARIALLNGFLFPILLYTGQFYLAPESIIKRVESACRALLLPKYAAIPLKCLYASPQRGGVYPTLLHFSSANRAAIIRCQYPLFRARYLGMRVEFFGFEERSPLASLSEALGYGLKNVEGTLASIPQRTHAGVLERVNVSQTDTYKLLRHMSGVEKQAESKMRDKILSRWVKAGDDQSPGAMQGYMATYQTLVGMVAGMRPLIQCFKWHRWLLYNALPLAARFSFLRDDFESNKCPRCNMDRETSLHFLVDCEVAKSSLEEVRKHLVEDNLSTWDDTTTPLTHLHLALLVSQDFLHPAHIIKWIQASYIVRNDLTHGRLGEVTIEAQVCRIVDHFKNMRTPLKARKPPPWP